MSDTTIKTPPISGVNPLIPKPAEKRWVVVVCDRVWEEDEEGKDRRFLNPQYVLSPKGGEPASLLDSKTWGDLSMAYMRAQMVREKNRRAWSGYNSTTQLGFVHEGRLYWENGDHAVKRTAR